MSKTIKQGIRDFKNVSGVYCIFYLNENKKYFYIGSSRNIGNRLNQHMIGMATGNHTSLQEAYNASGKDISKFRCRIMEKVHLAENDDNYRKGHILQTREQFWINHCKETNVLCNRSMNAFGTAGMHFKCSEETKKKISEKNKGHLVSQQTRDKISQAMKGIPLPEEKRLKRLGKTPWNKGVPMSEEQKENLRIKNTGKKLSLETRKKLSETMKKRDHSFYEKLSVLFTGRQSPMKGRKHTEETKQKMRQAHKNAKNTWNKNSIWVNNGEINKMVSADSIPEGFVPGRLKTRKHNQ